MCQIWTLPIIMIKMQSPFPLYFCLFVCILTLLITTHHFTKQKASKPVDHRVRTICQNHVKQKTMHSIVLHGAKRKSFSLEKHTHTHISLLDSKWPRHWTRRTITHTRTRMGKILAWLVVFPERERNRAGERICQFLRELFPFFPPIHSRVKWWKSAPNFTTQKRRFY